MKLRTSKGKELLTRFAEPLDFSSGPVKFTVLVACTVRAGTDSTTAKVGEYKKGDTIEIVNEATNNDGLKVYQTTTAPKGADTGGWVKLRTSKGKELISVCANEDPEPQDYSCGPVRWTVLAACTVRAGPDSTSARVGQFKKGDTVEIVNEATNSDGLRVRTLLTSPLFFLQSFGKGTTDSMGAGVPDSYSSERRRHRRVGEAEDIQGQGSDYRDGYLVLSFFPSTTRDFSPVMNESWHTSRVSQFFKGRLRHNLAGFRAGTLSDAP